MSRNSSGLLGALVAVGALGATAVALRRSQRQRLQGPSPHRELTRWEGEGGALATGGASAPAGPARGDAGGEAGGEVASAHGATAAAWPFPRS